MQRVSHFHLLRYIQSLTWAMNLGKDGSEPFGLGKLFADPNLLGKLATNPRTQKHLADPSFVQKVPSSRHLSRYKLTIFPA